MDKTGIAKLYHQYKNNEKFNDLYNKIYELNPKLKKYIKNTFLINKPELFNAFDNTTVTDLPEDTTQYKQIIYGDSHLFR